MRYFLELAYNGVPFHGWQSQPNAVSVQSTIENALSLLFRETISITGAGRTDTGVHARQMFAHFDLRNKIDDYRRFLKSLNSLLGKDIAVYNVFPVNNESHARFDASSRMYKYFITFNKNPFLYNCCSFSSQPLKLEEMNMASNLLLSTKDFTSFAKLHTDVKTNICNVTQAHWEFIKNDVETQAFLGNLKDGIVFTIEADRFLRNMVRAIVGTLIEIGRGKISIKDFQRIIESKNRCEAGISMPPQALFLWKISYPFL